MCACRANPVPPSWLEFGCSFWSDRLIFVGSAVVVVVVVVVDIDIDVATCYDYVINTIVVVGYTHLINCSLTQAVSSSTLVLLTIPY
jgi:hypothetical protein